jgi:hypothetical protein
MSVRRVLTAAIAILALATGSAAGSEQIPFRGVWSGYTVSAVPVDENVVLVTSRGTGQSTHLGRFTMESPHFTYLDTLEVEGEQIFTGANGDTITARISGQFVETSAGTLEAILSGVITGGTGRFLGASGSYDFVITAIPAAFGFESTAIFAGTIASPGSLK